MRLRLYDLRTSDFPATNGLCASDIAGVAKLANRCERRLIFAKEAGEEGWHGSFAEVQLNNISRSNPFITLSRHIARIEALTVCDRAVPVQNQFYEYLTYGNGRMPRSCHMDNFRVMQGFARNNVATFSDLPQPPQLIRIYCNNPADEQAGLRVLLQGKDATNQTIYSQDGENIVKGEYVILDSPFATSVNAFQTPLSGIQKDITSGTLQFMAVNADGTETPIHTMEPSEEVAGYRRYYLHNLPCNCCNNATIPTAPCGPQAIQTLQARAICKLEIVPVQTDSDYFLLHNLEAMIEEARSVHFSDMEDATSKGEAAIHHLNAVRLLASELRHYYGKDQPAVNFAPFGSARLERLNVSMM